MRFFRIWLSEYIQDIAYEGTKEELKSELDKMYPATLPRVEEFTFTHWQVITEIKRSNYHV